MITTNSKTLSEQIRRKIGFRVLVCIILYLVFFIAITAYDFSKGMTEVGRQVKNIAAQLDDYVISQILIDNEESVRVKLQEESFHNKMSITWSEAKGARDTGLNWSFPLGWSYASSLSTSDGARYGYLVFNGSFLNNKDFMLEMMVRVLFLALFLMFMLLILYPLTSRIPKTLFIEPLLNLLSLLKTPESYRKNTSVIMDSSELNQIESEIISLLERARRDSRNAAIGEIASQVAHDIRSPLAALNVWMGQNSWVKKDRQQLLQNSINRINDIANNLLKDNEEQLLSHFKNDTDALDESFVFPSVNSLLLEKELELSDEVIFKVKVSDAFHMAYSRINKPVLNRIISNIINNAFDSIQNNGVIQVELCVISGWCSISIKDNGCGMTEEIKQKMFDHGFSYGKENGSGIGMSYSKTKIKSWGGEIQVDSKLGFGTEVTIKLPVITPPPYLAFNVNIIEDSSLVIVDDEQLVHDAWEARIGQISIEKNISIKIVHLYSPSEFESWYSQSRRDECCHFFIDYELNDSLNGIDIINKYATNEQFYLVTSKYDDLAVCKACQYKKILLIPKGLLQFVEIQFCYRTPMLVFIDDDISLGKAWMYKAEFTGNKIIYCKTISEFNSLKKYISLLTPVYIDSDLKTDKRGEEYAKNIYDFGFHEIYLATGMPANMKSKPGWIKSIVSKEPPF